MRAHDAATCLSVLCESSLGRISSRRPVPPEHLLRRPLLLAAVDPLGLDDLPAAGNRVSRAGLSPPLLERLVSSAGGVAWGAWSPPPGSPGGGGAGSRRPLDYQGVAWAGSPVCRQSVCGSACGGPARGWGGVCRGWGPGGVCRPAGRMNTRGTEWAWWCFGS